MFEVIISKIRHLRSGFLFLLKELRNHISFIIRLWSLFCSIQIYVILCFSLIFLKTSFLSLASMLSL